MENKIKEVCCKKDLDIVVNDITVFKFERGQCYTVSECSRNGIVVTVDFMHFIFYREKSEDVYVKAVNSTYRYLYDNFYTVNEQRKRKIKSILN
jgi:hypothetical protein